MISQNRQMQTLFFTLVVIMMGFGMVIPILPFLVESFGAGGSELGALMASYAIMQFIFSPVWGRLSDRFGRKPVLMVGVLGNALAQALFGLSSQLWMLFAARILAGVLSSAVMPTAMAYISDSTPEQDRSAGMGILGAAMGLGMVLGPGVAGALGSRVLSLPFFIAAMLSLLALLLVAMVLPESLPADKREYTGAIRNGPLLRPLWDALFSQIGFLLFMAFLLSFALTNFEAVFGLFTQQRFNYGPWEVGILLTAIGLVSAIVQGGLTGPLSRQWGEGAIIKASLAGSAIGFVLMTLAMKPLSLWLSIIFFVLSNAMLRPAVSALISRETTTGQGVAMGLNNSFMSLGRIIGPLWAGFAFDMSMNLPYWSGAILLVFGFMLSIRQLDQFAKPAPNPAFETRTTK
jgi:DHA1 family multidrug resistance protein-like MFS transporter